VLGDVRQARGDAGHEARGALALEQLVHVARRNTVARARTAGRAPHRKDLKPRFSAGPALYFFKGIGPRRYPGGSFGRMNWVCPLMIGLCWLSLQLVSLMKVSDGRRR
jgi:hypothetical protein